MANDKIIFSSKSKEYSFLSNSYISDMTIDDKLYYHVEGYYQASKYIGIDDKHAERIRYIYSPIIAKKNGEKYSMSDDRKSKWESGYKLIVMRRAVLTKYITNQDLAKKLITTGEKKLVCQDIDNNYWSNGSDNKGENMLGRILMEVRDIIKNMPNESEY